MRSQLSYTVMTLREYIKLQRGNRRYLAVALDTGGSYLSQIASGSRRPGLVLALRICAATGGLVTPAELLQGSPVIKKIDSP